MYNPWVKLRIASAQTASFAKYYVVSTKSNLNQNSKLLFSAWRKQQHFITIGTRSLRKRLLELALRQPV
jgi:hypothetical protein